MLSLADEFVKNTNIKLNDYERDFLNKILSMKTFSFSETRTLFSKIKEENDLEARRKLIEGNLKKVVIISKNYLNRGLDFFDIFQEGYRGLEKAVEKFNPKDKTPFAQYSYFWIKQSINYALNFTSRTIRISHSTFDKNRNFINGIYTLENEYEREVTVKEIACDLNLPIDYVTLLLEKIKTTTSLETLLENNVLDNLINPSYLDNDFEDKVIRKIDNDNFISSLEKTLSEEQLKLIKLRFGFENGESYVLYEIAQEFNSSPETIRRRVNYILKIIKEHMLCDKEPLRKTEYDFLNMIAKLDILEDSNYNLVKVYCNKIIDIEIKKLDLDIKDQNNYKEIYDLLIQIYLYKIYQTYGYLEKQVMTFKLLFSSVSNKRIAELLNITEEDVVSITTVCLNKFIDILNDNLNLINKFKGNSYIKKHKE